ncbi:MAG: hypothetical protein ACJ763_04905 [Bdellovibrionia bacterium]
MEIFRRGIRSQLGQATTEYILVLAMVVSVFLLVFKGVLFPKLQQLQTQLSKRIESMYSGDNLHQLNFKISGPKK